MAARFRLRRWTALMVGIGLMALAGSPPAPAATTSSRSGDGVLLGFNSELGAWASGVSAAQEAELIKIAGGTVQRLDLHWAELQPAPGGPILFPAAAPSGASSYATDRAYAELVARAMVPVIVILDAPAWASGQPRSCGLLQLRCLLTSHRPALHPPTAGHVDAYAAFVRAVALRYPQAMIETWNEPEGRYFWGSLAPDPALMGAMQCAAYDALHQVDVTGRLLSPGLGVALETTADVVAYEPYVQELARAMGGRVCWDHLSVHSYPGTSYRGDGSQLERQLAAVRAQRSAMGDRSPIWVTEIGWAVGPRVRPADQRDFVAHVVSRLASEPGVAAVVLNTLRDHGWPHAGPGTPEHGFGVLGQGLAPKPSYCWLVARAGNHYGGC